jgi:glycosyltransferase involved in cell wall biosynthesis
MEPRISVVVPAFNEAPNLPALVREVEEAVSPLGDPWELVVVDDGSTDGSAALLKNLQAGSSPLRLVRFARNAGQSAAFLAGFEAARGEVVVTLDADLQNPPEEIPKLVERIREVLDDVVSEVRVSHRLTDSPSCLVQGEHEMAMHMQRLMKQAGHEVPLSKPSLEVNPEHALVKRLRREQDSERFAEWSRLLFEQAMLTQGAQLEDPTAFVRRLNRILVELSES